MVRVSWRDSDDDPWRCITDFAIKSAGELRSLMAAALAAGQLKHKFYRLDPGQPLPRWTASHGRENDEGETNMSKLAQTITAGVKPLKHSKGDVKKAAKKAAANVKPVADLKPNSGDEVKTKAAAKAAERKAKKEESQVKKAAAKEAKAKVKAEKKVKKAEARAAAKESKAKAKAERKAKHANQWFIVQEDVSNKTAKGPFESISKATASIGTMGDDIHPGREHDGIYRRIKGQRRRDVKKDEKPKVIATHIICDAATMAKQGYTVPVVKVVSVGEAPAPLRRRN